MKWQKSIIVVSLIILTCIIVGGIIYAKANFSLFGIDSIPRIYGKLENLTQQLRDREAAYDQLVTLSRAIVSKGVERTREYQARIRGLAAAEQEAGRLIREQDQSLERLSRAIAEGHSGARTGTTAIGDAIGKIEKLGEISRGIRKEFERIEGKEQK